MRLSCLIAVLPVLTLIACGPGADKAGEGPAKPSSAKSAEPTPNTPVLPGVGVVIASDLKSVTLDHEGVAGGLPAGRHQFRSYGDVVAEAPLDPGSRVAFTYQDWKPLPVLTELKPR